MSFCVSRKKSAYGETGLDREREASVSRERKRDAGVLLRLIGVFAFLFRLLLLLHDLRSDGDRLEREGEHLALRSPPTPTMPRLSDEAVGSGGGGGVHVSSASLVDDC